MARAIGREHTSLPSRTKAPKVRGCMPTCIARKAIRTTRRTGTAGRGSPFAESHWMRNGSVSREICWGRSTSSFLYSESVVADDTSPPQPLWRDFIGRKTTVPISEIFLPRGGRERDSTMSDPFLTVTRVSTEQGAVTETLKAALQQRQNKVYARDEVGNERRTFRLELARMMREESRRYIQRVQPASDDEHCAA